MVITWDLLSFNTANKVPNKLANTCNRALALAVHDLIVYLLGLGINHEE